MKSRIFFAALLALSSIITNAALADTTEVNLSAKQFSGFDKITGGNQVKKVKDCAYLVMQQDAFNGNPAVLAVGLNSTSAPYNNFLIRIPLTQLPLKNGAVIADLRYKKVVYQDGVLTATREKTGEGSANESETVTLQVSEDLQQISIGNVEKLEGLIFKTPIAKMECQF